MPFGISQGPSILHVSFDDEDKPVAMAMNLYGIDIKEVDRDRERLALVIAHDEEKDENVVLRFALEDDEGGNPRLRLDLDNSDELMVEGLKGALSDIFGLNDPSELIVSYLMEAEPTTRPLAITTPMTLIAQFGVQLVDLTVPEQPGYPQRFESVTID